MLPMRPLKAHYIAVLIFTHSFQLAVSSPPSLDGASGVPSGGLPPSEILQTANERKIIFDLIQTAALASAGAATLATLFVHFKMPRVKIRGVKAPLFFARILYGAILIYLLACLGGSAFGWTKTPKNVIIGKPIAFDELVKEACEKFNDLAKVADETAEEVYGPKKWTQMWIVFELLFEWAQNVSHAQVIANATTLDIDEWPIMPPLPDTVDYPTPEQELAFNEEFTKWSHENLMTIPRIKHAMTDRYIDMHFKQTMDVLKQRADHPQFVNDSVAFEILSRVFLLRMSLPVYCRALSSSFSFIRYIYSIVDWISACCE